MNPSILSKVTDFFVEYLKNKPFTDVLLVLLIGVFIWNETNHTERTDKAHLHFKEYAAEHDAAAERNTDKIIEALTGIEKQQKKTTAAVQEVAKPATSE